MPFIVDVVFLFGNESQMSLDSFAGGWNKQTFTAVGSWLTLSKQLRSWKDKDGQEKNHMKMLYMKPFKSNVKHE